MTTPQTPTQDDGQQDSERTQVVIRVDLAPGERVQFVVEARPGEEGVQITRTDLPRGECGAAGASGTKKVGVRTRPVLGWREFLKEPQLSPGMIAWLRVHAHALLVGLSLLVYTLGLFIGLQGYPVGFRSEEAAAGVIAAEMLRDNFTYNGETLPGLFWFDGSYSLGLSPYLQMAAYGLFGNTVFAARLLPALFSIAAVWLAVRLLRDGFRLRHAWALPLLALLSPGWMLAARTGTPLMIFIALFLLCLYAALRSRSDPRWLFAEVAAGALAFYTMPSALPVLIAAGLLLIIYDLRFHITHWKFSLLALGLLALLSIPLIRFLLHHPGEFALTLGLNNSYWNASLSLPGRLMQLLKNLAVSFNPLYWFFPGERAVPAYYNIPGYGFLSLALLPLVLVGLWAALRRFRADGSQGSASRILAAALIAAPAAAAVSGLSFRLLFPLLPVLLLFATAGFSAALELLESLLSRRKQQVQAFALIALAVVAFTVHWDILTNSPRRHADFGGGGAQYGAPQAFDALRTYREKQPGDRLVISPTWTANVDWLARFFMPGASEIEFNLPDVQVHSVDTDLGHKVFLLTAQEYEQVVSSQHFDLPFIVDGIHDPAGQMHLLLVRLHYRPDLQAVLAAEHEARSQLVAEEIKIDDMRVQSRHSLLDGNIINLFDGNPDTLVKTLEANPLVVELSFPRPIQLGYVTLRTGAEPVEVTVTAWDENDERVAQVVVPGEQVSSFKNVVAPLGESMAVKRLRIELFDVDAFEPTNVHLWEITLAE